jgi:hypothetical protein
LQKDSRVGIKMPKSGIYTRGCAGIASIFTIAMLALAGSAPGSNLIVQYRGDSLRTGQAGYEATYSPQLAWQYKTGTTCSASPIVSSNGTVYFGAYDRYFYAVSSGGSLAWRSNRYSTSIVGSAGLGSSGTVYFATIGGSIYALNASGTSDWSSPCYIPSAAINASVLIGNNGTLYIGADNNSVYAIDKNGAVM